MSIPFSRAPHIEGTGVALHSPHAPNAALLIDFDNVTMGMRSDLSKELKTLLSSDVIRGKVTVQRAYADWRRYPQYIVPLSEASIDLIFAPAYGSSKKNATDIRMAIDGIELVFTRPEIGTFILLTGDSDFSSLVLKLKEYGKYVIGVGIQESSSDILVQNCDEYYSYTSLSGLRKTDEIGGASPSDPWALVERAVEQMGRRGDVMRSDRLKQVMLEIDPNFDEKSIGFNKFSRFVSEAGKKGLVQLQKMENGQYEIVPGKGVKKGEDRRGGEGGRRPERGRGDRGRGTGESRGSSDSSRAREEGMREAPASAGEGEGRAPAGAGLPAPDRGSLAAAYSLLRQAITELLADEDSDAVRDSDVKRRMLALQAGFDEADLGFPKFSRFLKQAHDHEVIDLRKGEGGNYEVALGPKTAPPEGPGLQLTGAGTDGAAAMTGPKLAVSGVDVPVASRLRPREGTAHGRTGGDEPPPFLEGQVVSRPRREGAVTASERTGVPPGEALDPVALRLPTEPDSVVQYLTNSYGGVGKKTAETLVDALGDRLFVVLQTDPARVAQLLPPARAEKLFEGWTADFARRRERFGEGQGAPRGEHAHPTPFEPPKTGAPGEGSTRVELEEPVAAGIPAEAAEALASPGDDFGGEPPSLLQPRLRRTRGGR